MTAAQWAQRLEGSGESRRGMQPPWRPPSYLECRELAALLRRAERVEETARSALRWLKWMTGDIDDSMMPPAQKVVEALREALEGGK